jgi:alpha-2-macroglobulin
MNRSTLAAIVVALMLGSGIGGYLIGRPAEHADRPAAPIASTTPQATPAKQVSTPPQAAAPLPAAAPTEAFAYRRLSIDSSSADGEACLSFNKPLAPTDRVKYDDYVRIAPDVKSAVRVVDDKLCVSGLVYGTDYTVRLLSGLPSQDGGKLDEERSVAVALGARPAVVSLAGKGFILPRGSAAGLPVTTVNVSRVGVAVFRVNERGLDRFSGDRYSSTSFPAGEAVTDKWSLRSWLNGENGIRQWRGTMEVRNVLNQPVTTAFPIRETIKDWKPGVYFVVVWNAAHPIARDDDAYDDDSSASTEVAGMWVVDTDIALTTFTGADGLNVFARSLDSAAPLPGLELVLLSSGNDPLGKAVTGADGRATFAAGLLKGHGAAEPIAVMASDPAKQDFSRLELSKSAFDLSDRGVDGRDPPGPVDAFLYTERGVYRPGETVQLMALMRDDGGAALKDVPVTLIVHRPDGSEFQRMTTSLLTVGALQQAIALPKSSRRGRWSVTAHIDAKAPPVGRVEFSVEDFVPEKLKVELTSDTALLRAGQPNTFTIAADFLYGAPAGGLNTEAEMSVSVDPSPFPAFANYEFGPEAERRKFEPPLITLTPPATDETGKSRVDWPGDGIKDTVLPLRAQIQARVFEPGNGRSTKTDLTLPLRTRDAYIGVRPAFEGRYSREGTETGFDVVAVDREGKQVARPAVDYTIEHISYAYQWYVVDGRWRWQGISNKRVIEANQLDLKADAPVRLSKRLPWGQYRLTVTDRQANTSTTTTFYVGWYGDEDSSEEPAPDTLRVAGDKQNYAPGEKARLHIEAPFAGQALVAIATDRIQTTYTVAVAPGGTDVEIPMKAEWGAGAYALVTAWRPLSTEADRTPVRAIGAVWLGLDPKLRTLAVEISAPEKITPRQHIEIPVRVANAQGAEAYVTLAAVDEGILQLTRYRTPNPAAYYFGKRKLGLAMRDDYGRLLDGRADELGRIRTGGDAGDIGGLDVVPTRTVALFSGPVKLDAEGRARIAFDIPDFIGQLRLMAVAYDPTRVGSSDAKLIVRDAVATDVILPRFLAPGDDGRVAISLHNVEGQPGDYRLTMEATGVVALDRPFAETRALALNQRDLLTANLRGTEVGMGKVAISLQGPGGFSVHREWDIQVRAAQTPSAVDTVTVLDPGRELTLSRDLTAGFAAGTSVVSVALSRTPGIDVPGLLRALDKYPYGCLEQTTSRALPLLYYNDVALLGYGPGDPKIGDRVQDAIYRIVDMQISDGSFGMWGPYATPAAEWLQAYALDFLVRARERQMTVPAASLQRGLTWLNRAAERFQPNSQAYAWYVLAKAGLADPGRVRYFQDTQAANGIEGGLAWSQLAAALNLVGEPGRARLALANAQRTVDQRDPNDYYGSPLRDRAALLALAPEAGGREAVAMVVGSVRERLTARIAQTTTQEQAWLVLAARALAGGSDLSYEIDGDANKTTTDPVVVNPDAAELGRGLRVKNTGERPVWVQVTARGVPRDPQPAASAGLSVQRDFLTLDGQAADLANVRQNDRLIVSLHGRQEDTGYHEVALLDLLPAGFEIEGVMTDDTVKSYPFVGEVTPTRIAEGRDDRFFAALNLGIRPYRWWNDEDTKFGRNFHVAYMVRAVTPGSFALPAVEVEDMYNPRVFARSGMGKVQIVPR